MEKSQKSLNFVVKYNELKANGKTKQCVNYLLDSFACRMFEVRKRQLYLFVDHYKHQEWKRDALVVRVGEINMSDGLYYQTDLI